MNVSQPMRVLHVVGAMNRGGVETWLLHVARHLDRTEFATDFLVHTDQPAAYDDELRRLGCRIIPCLHPSRPLRYGRAFRAAMAEHGPYDVLHSHVHHFSGLLMKLGRKCGIPVRIAHSHNDTRHQDAAAGFARRFYLGMMNRWIRVHATQRLAASKEAGLSLFGPRERQPWEVLYCSVDFDPFEAPSDRAGVLAEFGFPNDAIVMSHVGRFAEQKNHAFLLRIFAEAVRQEPKSRLLLVGEGPLRAAAEHLAQSLGIVEHVRFAGPRSDVPRLLKASDVFLLPSLHEGLPLVGMEVQAAGTPIVMTDSITSEVDSVPKLTHRLALNAPPAEWAALALVAARAFEDRTAALAHARRSPFDIRVGVRQLGGCYANAFARV
ncbi:MAG: glycosyltransferase [Gemmataceae bacterium]|nr:glycosyltransferase [Gemmataceae bacterium]